MPSSVDILITVDGVEKKDQVIGLNMVFKLDGKGATELDVNVDCSG